MTAYNRQALMTSMRTTIANESAAAKEGDKNSADNATTAEGETSEETSAETSGEEGGEAGADDSDEGGEASGSQDDSESEDTTAEGDEGKSTEEKASEEGDEGDEAKEGDDPAKAKKPEAASGKWEEGEAKDLKTWGLDKLSPSEETRKLLKIARDNQAAVQEQKQQLAVHSDYLAAVGNAIVNHDLESLNQMAEELGGDKLPFDLRTEADQIKEITDSYNGVFDALEANLKGDPATWAKVLEALSPAQKKTEKAIAALERKLETRSEVEKLLKDKGQTPVKGKYLESLQGKADKNFIELVKEEPKAKEYMEILKPIFKLGAVLQNPAKAFAMQPKATLELGEALHFKRKFKEVYYPKIREEIIAELKLKKLVKAPPSGKKGDNPGAGDPPKTPNPNRTFNHYAGRRLMQRVGR